MQSQISPAIESSLQLLAAVNETLAGIERAISKTLDPDALARLQASYSDAREARTIIAIRLRAEIAAAQKKQ